MITEQEPRVRLTSESRGKDLRGFNGVFGRGSWIRTNDLQYPKLTRYQAALYPDYLGNDVDTRLKRRQQGGLRAVSSAATSSALKERMRHAISGRDAVFFGRP